MRPIITLPGVALDQPTALPAVRTPEGIAMGGIPGWELFANPEFLVGGMPRNRARPNSVLSANGPIPGVTTFPANGQPAIDATPLADRSANPGIAFPASEWTAFAVVEVVNTTSDKAFFRSLTDQTNNAGLSLRMGLNNACNALTIYRGAAAANFFLTYTLPSGNFSGRCILAMFCGSARGASIFLDGEEVAVSAEPGIITAGFAAGQWKTQAAQGVRMGHYGVLSRDLGRPQYRAYRERMVAFYKKKYAIF